MHTFLFVWPLFGAIIWRLGGGAFTSLTGISFGTDFARAMRATLALIFCFAIGWYGLVAVAALFFGVIIAGWGPFQGMGSEGSNVIPEKSIYQWLPNALGLKAGTFWHDFVGMLQCGFDCMFPLALILLLFGNPYGGKQLTVFWPDIINNFPVALTILGLGLLFSPCYALARLPWPNIPKFTIGQEWGEVFVGAMLGAGFAWITLAISP